MTTTDLVTAVRTLLSQTRPAPPADATEADLDHWRHDLQMGQATTRAEFAEIEQAERHVPTAEERAGYAEFCENVRRYPR